MNQRTKGAVKWRGGVQILGVKFSPAGRGMSLRTRWADFEASGHPYFLHAACARGPEAPKKPELGVVSSW